MNFTDAHGKSWLVQITAKTARDLKNDIGFNIMDVFEASLFETLFRNPVLIADILYVICKDEAEKLGISSEDFGRRLTGQALEEGTDAFIQALGVFFPRYRQVLEKSLMTHREVEEIVCQRILEQLETTNLMKNVDESLNKNILTS